MHVARGIRIKIDLDMEQWKIDRHRGGWIQPQKGFSGQLIFVLDGKNTFTSGVGESFRRDLMRCLEWLWKERDAYCNPQTPTKLVGTLPFDLGTLPRDKWTSSHVMAMRGASSIPLILEALPSGQIRMLWASKYGRELPEHEHHLARLIDMEALIARDLFLDALDRARLKAGAVIFRHFPQLVEDPGYRFLKPDCSPEKYSDEDVLCDPMIRVIEVNRFMGVGLPTESYVTLGALVNANLPSRRAVWGEEAHLAGCRLYYWDGNTKIRIARSPAPGTQQ